MYALERNNIEYFIKISQLTVKIFEDGSRPPSWICLGHTWTTHTEYLIDCFLMLELTKQVFICHSLLNAFVKFTITQDIWQRQC